MKAIRPVDAIESNIANFLGERDSTPLTSTVVVIAGSPDVEVLRAGSAYLQLRIVAKPAFTSKTLAAMTAAEATKVAAALIYHAQFLPR
jgi:hypothetical protein